ncbi:Citreoviridin biosynthesis protein D [Lachnellula arida]|uniref:Citreoviridin biosynthesis protein D n=1 Tax=Lachnellula arida TaxID=1316785 RepID=A0A8T9BTY5_9HELO|nr:Citreoviridin biosynthesis protein D [Lachnellula arida]
MSLSSGTPSTLLTGHTPARWYHFRARTIVLILLPVLSLWGAYGTWGLARSNGLLTAIPALFAEELPKFPGTEVPLLLRYTGFKAIDYRLSTLVVFSAPVLDLSHADLTLFGVHGFGQFGAAWTLMMMESMRMGNRFRAVSYIGTVGVLFQQLTLISISIVGALFLNLSFAVVVPLWLFLHILMSPVAKPFPGTHANRVLLVPSWDLRFLPFSIVLGYIVPSLLMALPSPKIVDPSLHQIYIAFWHAFPIWTVGIHAITIRASQWIVKKMWDETNAKPPKPQGTSYLNNVKHVYRFVLALCIITHVPVVVIALLPPWAIPESTPTLAFLGKNNILDIFVPYFPRPSYRVHVLAEGVHTFLMWDLYIGAAALLTWAVLLYRNATSEKAIVDPNKSLPIYGELFLGNRPQDAPLWRKLFPKIALWTLVSGPIGALAILLWERDAIVRQKIKQGL